MTAAFVAAMLPAATVAAAADRTAVFIASGTGADAALGDNLSEVAIAKLAEQSPGEWVGTRELRRWLDKSGETGSVPACISRASCLRRLGAGLGVSKLISGRVLADHDQFTIALTLLDVHSGLVEATSTKRARGDLDQVIRGVQDAVTDLLKPKLPMPRLELSVAGQPAAVATGERFGETEGAGRPEPRWPFYLGLGGAAATVLSLSAAGLFGVLASEEPTGATRADQQRDLAVRDAYAGAANMLLIVGGTLGAASIALFTWQRPRAVAR